MTAKKPTSPALADNSKHNSQFDLLAQFNVIAQREVALDAVRDACVLAVSAGLNAKLGAFVEFAPSGATVALRSGTGWRGGVTDLAALPTEDLVPPDWRIFNDGPRGTVTPALVLSDLRTAQPPSTLAFLRTEGVVSGLAVPVDYDGTHGLLAVFTRAQQTFSPADTQFLVSMAACFAAAAARALHDREVRNSEARSAGIIASAMDAIIAVDESQRIVLFNHAAEQVFGCPVGDALGGTLDRFIPAHLRPAHRDHIANFGASGATTRRMGRLNELAAVRTTGEEFPIEASISHAEVGGKRVFTVILRDVSERRRLEEQLLHSQKLESVGRLAGGIAHDFNNVLTAIFGFLDLARAHAGTKGPLRECLDMVQTASQRAADLTSKLLAFARKQVIAPQSVDLNKLIRGVNGMVGSLLGDDVEIIVHEGPLLPAVRVDPGQFEHVLINLAVNARDAMPKGGKFIIETSRVELGPEQAPLYPDMQPGRYVLLAVSDTGMGMDPATLEHCFEPFFTTKRLGRGTGLGLSSCHGIVKQSGGHITVYSELGHGTTFRILLPVADEEPVAAVPSGAADGTHGGAETILLVEDDALVRGIAVRVLRDAGYTVLEAGDAEEALTRSSQHTGPIHLLLTDVVLPRIGGAALAEKLHEKRPELPVLYTSGFTDNVIEEHGVLAPGAQFLAKPYTPRSLSQKVRQTLENAPSAPPER